MTLPQYYNLFEDLKIKATTKSEIKTHTKFLYIITKLRGREFSKDQIKSIETKLDSLNLESNPKNRNRYFIKALRQFEQFIKTQFSLTTKGYYTNQGIALGSSSGVFLGIIFLSNRERSLGISLGLIIGMVIGLTIGKQMDLKAADEGRVL